MAASPHPFPLTPEQWEQELIRVLETDVQAHDDPMVSQLLTDPDTLHHAADHVRRYVTDFWKRVNEDRGLYGGEMRQNLESAIAGQKTTIKVVEEVIARLDEAEFNQQAPIQINSHKYLVMARELCAQLEYMRDHAAAAFNPKSMRDKGDLQTLYSLDCFLRHRLGSFSYDTLATLLDCGRTVECQIKQQVVEDGKNLKNRLDNFRKNKPWLAEQTEAAARSIPRK